MTTQSTAAVPIVSSAQAQKINCDCFWYDYFKRGFDFVGSLLLLIFLLPVMFFIVIAVKLSSSGPIIFSQKRLTQGGRIFTMYKFRTMRVDAENKTGPIWAAAIDPRVTSVGRFLRISRLDELPQLLNVLIGDMSLIGPRPERPEIAAELIKEFPNFDQRLNVKAGITGLAQIALGYASCVNSYRRKLNYDLIYINNRCLLLDLRIALKTIRVVLTGHGAR